MAGFGSIWMSSWEEKELVSKNYLSRIEPSRLEKNKNYTLNYHVGVRALQWLCDLLSEARAVSCGRLLCQACAAVRCPLCSDCTTFDPLGSKLYKSSIDRYSVIPGLHPKTKICRSKRKLPAVHWINCWSALMYGYRVTKLEIRIGANVAQ